jgi:hypothetical protein
MDATLYTGQGVVQTVVNAGQFKPDLVWQKPRNEVASHRLVDSVRGVNNVIYSNQTAAQSTETTTLTAFNSNGFTGGGSNAVSSGNTAVAWQWQAGQGSSSSNTSGSITSTVSVNTTAGFSVVTYTGTGSSGTVGHGLGITPSMIIVKQRSTTGGWFVNHSAISATQNLYLQATDSVQSDNVYASRSSTTFGITGSAGINGSGVTFVAYCWAEIAGFSKFGSYTGNGSADGPFVYLGFRPEFIMVKSSSSVADWNMWDTSRSPYNQGGQTLWANLTNVEYTAAVFYDILSNGFKLRDTNAESNANTQTYIYMAFAENPFKNANAR